MLIYWRKFCWLSILLKLALTSGVSWLTAKQFLLLVSISLFCFKIGYFSCCFLGIDSSLRYEILCCSNFVEDFLLLHSVTAELEWLLWSWTAKQFLLYEDYGSQILQSILDACFLSAVPVLTDLYLMGWVDSLSQQVLYIHLGLSVSVVECYVVDQ